MNKQEILTQIEPLFFEKAFAEVSMDDIASALNIKKASLYYHFPSKETLFLEVLTLSFERYKKAFEEILIQENLSPETLIKNLVQLPLESKNLFSIVTQRGYCQIDAIRKEIVILETQIMVLFQNFLLQKYTLTQERSSALFMLIDALAKRKCLSDDCTQERMDSIIQEVVRCFFFLA